MLIKPGIIAAGAPILPAIDLNFATATYAGGTLSSLVSATNSGGYVQNADNTLTLFAANTPRIGVGNGLFIEPAATNAALHSQGVFSSGSFYARLNASVTDNVAAAPDGTTTASLVTFSASNGILAPASGIAVAQPHNASIYVKQGTQGTAVTLFNNTTGFATYSFSFSSPTGNYQALANGWYRIWLPDTQAASIVFQIRGTNSGDNFYVWGLQAESGLIPTSYIPTTTATVTRTADNIAASGALATLLARSNATITAQTNAGVASTAATIIDANGVVLLGKTAGNLGTTAVGATLNTATAGTWTGATTLELAWDGTGGLLQLNGGGLVTSDTTARTPSGTFHLGSTSGSSAFFNGFITRLTGYNAKVPLVSPPAGFTMTQLAYANQIFQRDTMTGGGGKGTGSIPLTINATAIGQIRARTRSVADGVTILQSSYIAGNVTSTGSQTFTVTAINAMLGWFYLDLSPDGTTWQNGTTAVGMGVLAVLSGQSLAYRMFEMLNDTTTLAASGVTLNDNSRIFATVNSSSAPTSWRQAADATTDLNAAGVPEFCNKLIALSGVNVGMVGYAVGGTQTSQWLPGQALNTTLLATLDAAGGKFEIVWWFNGHSDSSNGVSNTTYQANLTSIFGSIAAHNSFASPVKLTTSIPYLGNPWGQVWQEEAVRKASYDWANANGGISVMFSDQESVTDYTHPTQVGVRRMAWHAYRALRPHFGATHSDAGATLGAATKSGVNLSIPFTLQSGATQLSLGGAGNGSNIFKVYNGGDRSTPLAFDATTPFALDNVGKTITLKLATDPGAVPLSILPFGLLDFQTVTPIVNNLYDDITDNDGITIGRQLSFTPNPIKIVTSRDLTGGGTPAYTTGKFGQAMSGGYGTLTAPSTPGLGTGFCYEAWVQVVTPDSVNTQTIFGSVAGVVVSVLGNNLLVQCDTSTARTYTSALPTGSWVHVAVVFDSGNLGAFVYINGVKNATLPGFFNVNSFVANNPWSIRRLGNQTTNDAGTGLLVDEVALFEGVRYTANFTPPSAAYVGNEAGLVSLYHLDSGLTNSAS